MQIVKVAPEKCNNLFCHATITLEPNLDPTVKDGGRASWIAYLCVQIYGSGRARNPTLPISSGVTALCFQLLFPN